VPFFSQSSTTADEMLTVVMLPDYTDTCMVGGKSEWKRMDLAHGITGTLSEWLTCAGVTMDSNPADVLQEAPVGMSPHLRTMGFRLELTLEYTNDAHSYPDHAIVCLVTAQVVPAWQMRTNTDYVLLGALDNGRRAWRNRLAHGVVVQLKVTGDFRKFDFKKFMDFFVSSLVLLQLPFHISEFIALYMLGFISEIHRSAKRSKLNVSNDFYSTIARMLVAEMGFRGLMRGQWKGSIKHLSGLTSQDLLHHIYGVFNEEIQSGVLQRHELQRMAIATFSHLDQHSKGIITANDFIRECTTNESISVKNAAKLFDEEQAYGLMQRILDNSHSQRMKIFAMTDSQADLKRSMSMSEGSDDDAAGEHDGQGEVSPRTSMQSESVRRTPPEPSAASLWNKDNVMHWSKDDLMHGDSGVTEAKLEQRLQALEEMDRVFQAMQLESRIAVLEAAESRQRSQALQQGKTAKDFQVEKDRKPMSAPQTSPETSEKASDVAHAIATQGGDKARWFAEEDVQLLNLVAKTQDLDDAIARLREKMDLQVMQVEAMMSHQERQICSALEQRCSAIEDRLRESVESAHQRTLCSAASVASSDGLAEQPQSMLQEATNLTTNLSPEDNDNPFFTSPMPPRTHASLSDMLRDARTVSVWHPFADGRVRDSQRHPFDDGRRRDSERQDRRSDSEGSFRGSGSSVKGSNARASSHIRGVREI